MTRTGVLPAACCLLPVLFACARPATFGDPVPPPVQAEPVVAAPAPVPFPLAAPSDTVIPPRERVAPPRVAFQLGLMPVASTGVTGFRLAHPTYDGRGVLIAILDSGVDPGIEGLLRTSTGAPKILDLRDFSGEGDIELREAGAGRWVGVLRELSFGPLPQGDFNGNGSNRDIFPIEVQRDSLGWAARVDTNGDGSLANEQWYHDFLVRPETFTFTLARSPGARGPITAALNIAEEGGRPKLAVYLDTSGHGAHVAGIAAGYNIYGVAGFHGVAPGAQIIGLRIADNVRGGVSTTGSMLRGMEYAVRFAAERRLPLVLNMSFGVGNANEGRAAMDSIIDAFLIQHPEIIFTIAAGNDGPGTSTTGLPGSAELAVSVGASYPASLAAVQFDTPTEVIGWWSSRGGETAKPDIITPGLAYSTVPGWNTGEEVKGGTSMASPHAAGLAAILISAMIAEQKPYSAASILQALRATARPFPNAPWVDQGPGLAQIDAAYAWLRGSHDAPRFRVQALAAAGATPPGMMPGGSGVAPAGRVTSVPGAYRRNGLASPADTVQRFRVSLVPDRGVSREARSYRLTSSAPWLRPAQPTVTVDAATGSAVVELRYDASALRTAGRHAATVTGHLAGDSSGGPAFVLVNTVVVPMPLPVAARRLKTTAGTANRWFVTVPENAGGLAVHLSAPDTTALGSLFVFEPTGRPARGATSEDVGGASGKTADVAVSGNDIVPGVWEVVVQAMPGADLSYDLDIRLPTAAIAAIDSTGAEPSVRLAPRDGGAATSRLEQIGIDTSWVGTIASVFDRHAFVVPTWARQMITEVEVTPDLWDRMTDFAITVYDSAGARIGNGAMNYPFHRVTSDLPEGRSAGYRAVLELFPAFGAPVAERFTARVRVRFEGEGLPATPLRGQYDPPAGWRRVLRETAGNGPSDWASLVRTFGFTGP